MPRCTELRLQVPAQAPAPAPQPRTDGRIIATPYAKKLAKDLGVDLASVAGSGPAGRITASDVEAIRGNGAGAMPFLSVRLTIGKPVALISQLVSHGLLDLLRPKIPVLPGANPARLHMI